MPGARSFPQAPTSAAERGTTTRPRPTPVPSPSSLASQSIRPPIKLHHFSFEPQSFAHPDDVPRDPESSNFCLGNQKMQLRAPRCPNRLPSYSARQLHRIKAPSSPSLPLPQQQPQPRASGSQSRRAPLRYIASAAPLTPARARRNGTSPLFSSSSGSARGPLVPLRMRPPQVLKRPKPAHGHGRAEQEEREV